MVDWYLPIGIDSKSLVLSQLASQDVQVIVIAPCGRNCPVALWHLESTVNMLSDTEPFLFVF